MLLPAPAPTTCRLAGVKVAPRLPRRGRQGALLGARRFLGQTWRPRRLRLVKLYHRGVLVKTHPRQRPGAAVHRPRGPAGRAAGYALRDLDRLIGTCAGHGDASGSTPDGPGRPAALDQDARLQLLGLVRRYGPDPVEAGLRPSAAARRRLRHQDRLHARTRHRTHHPRATHHRRHVNPTRQATEFASRTTSTARAGPPSPPRGPARPTMGPPSPPRGPPSPPRGPPSPPRGPPGHRGDQHAHPHRRRRPRHRQQRHRQRRHRARRGPRHDPGTGAHPMTNTTSTRPSPDPLERRTHPRADRPGRGRPVTGPARPETVRPQGHPARAARAGPPTTPGPRRVPGAAAGRRGRPPRVPLGEPARGQGRPRPGHADPDLGRTPRPELRPHPVVRPDLATVHRGRHRRPDPWTRRSRQDPPGHRARTRRHQAPDERRLRPRRQTVHPATRQPAWTTPSKPRSAASPPGTC